MSIRSTVIACGLLLAGCQQRPVSLDCSGAAPQGAATTPLETGQREVQTALAAAGLGQRVCLFTAWDPGVEQAFGAAGVWLDPHPESFTAINTPTGVAVLGRDSAGAMYGAMEVAERIRALGPKAFPLEKPLQGAPYIAIRGANLFIVLPKHGESAAWWFHSMEFWNGYLDLLARSRLNFLDLHGMYNIDNTYFPNALLYFATSGAFPGIGIPPDQRRRNLEVLNEVVKLAAARGIRVGLMSYRADLSLTGLSAPQVRLGEADHQRYVREAAYDLARSVPALWRLGFRIGESMRDAGWYNDTFIAGVHEAKTGLEMYTRTWLTDKPAVLATASAAGGHFIVEAKLNGEQLGPAYPIAGGMVSRRWPHYSYEGYLEPPAPYTFVFQVRASGTHRIFREVSLERARRLAIAIAGTSAAGFTYEFPHAYFPQRDYYHAPGDAFSTWTFRRDELQYLLAGRLAYDPETPEAVFRAALAERAGTDALWPALQAASEIVPWIQSAHMCGPDHRDFAPELELGGPVGYWSQPATVKSPPHSCAGYHGPFDTFAIASPHEAAVDFVAGRESTRLSPIEVSRIVLAAAAEARKAGDISVDPRNAEARDLVRESIALADLGDYFGHKLRAATALAVYANSARADYLAAARAESALATRGFTALAADTSYIQPFSEMLRMSALGIHPFHWKAELPWLAEEEPSIQAIVDQVAAAPPHAGAALPPAEAWLVRQRTAGPGLQSLDITPHNGTATVWTVTARLETQPPPGTSVRILWKPFSNVGDWRPARTTGQGTSWRATITGGGGGGLFAVEVSPPGKDGWRYPDVLGETPYVTLTPRQVE
jgi:hypothetical protein